MSLLLRPPRNSALGWMQPSPPKCAAKIGAVGQKKLADPFPPDFPKKPAPQPPGKPFFRDSTTYVTLSGDPPRTLLRAFQRQSYGHSTIIFREPLRIKATPKLCEHSQEHVEGTCATVVRIFGNTKRRPPKHVVRTK